MLRPCSEQPLSRSCGSNVAYKIYFGERPRVIAGSEGLPGVPVPLAALYSAGSRSRPAVRAGDADPVFGGDRPALRVAVGVAGRGDHHRRAIRGERDARLDAVRLRGDGEIGDLRAALVVCERHPTVGHDPCGQRAGGPPLVAQGDAWSLLWPASSAPLASRTSSVPSSWRTSRIFPANAISETPPSTTCRACLREVLDPQRSAGGERRLRTVRVDQQSVDQARPLGGPNGLLARNPDSHSARHAVPDGDVPGWVDVVYLAVGCPCQAGARCGVTRPSTRHPGAVCGADLGVGVGIRRSQDEPAIRCPQCVAVCRAVVLDVERRRDGAVQIEAGTFGPNDAAGPLTATAWLSGLVAIRRPVHAEHDVGTSNCAPS